MKGCPEGYEAETADYQNTVHVISGDPAEYIMSVNVHRRHMTSEQKREVIAKMLKAHPEKSDRQIAEMVKASPTTIGTAGAKMEATGDVSKLDTRTDKRGREQPANKPPPAREPTDEQREIGKRNAKTLAFAVTGKVGAVTSPTPIAAPALQPAAVAVDPGEIAGPANALYVGLAGLDPILDRIAQLGVDAFWRHSGDGARVLQQVESSLEFLRPLAALAPSKTTAPDIDRRRETA